MSTTERIMVNHTNPNGTHVSVPGDATIGGHVFIASDVRLGINVVIEEYARLHSGVVVGDYSRLQTESSIENDCTIGEASVICSVRIGKGCRIGNHSLIDVDLPPTTVIGSNVVVTDRSVVKLSTPA